LSETIPVMCFVPAHGPVWPCCCIGHAVVRPIVDHLGNRNRGSMVFVVFLLLGKNRPGVGSGSRSPPATGNNSGKSSGDKARATCEYE
jgi:hypothetical protein